MGYRPDGKYMWMARQDSLIVADGATGREVKTLSVGAMTINAAFGPGSELYVVQSGGRFPKGK